MIFESIRHSRPDSPKKRLSKEKKLVIVVGLLLIMTAVCLYLVVDTINAGAKAAFSSYNSSFAAERSLTYDAFYKKYYDEAEQRYHVANQVGISIGNLQEMAALEVLEVSDVEFIIEDSSDNKENITSWLEVPGTGVYVVDLRAAEFIVDTERSHVLARVPYPKLTNITIDYANIRKLLFKNDMLNDSYRVGEELAQNQLNAAYSLIQRELTTNQYFYDSAERAGKSTIIYLVKQFNPEISDLRVEVEFY